MKQGQDEFFAVIGEGAALLMSLDEQSSGFFDGLNRLREILAILGYSTATQPIAFSLGDPDGSAEALWDYLGNGLKLLPDEVAAFEAMSVQSLAHVIDQPSLVRESSRLAWVNGHHPDRDETKLAVFKHYAGRGVDHGIPQHVLEASFAEANALMKDKASDTPEYKAAHDFYHQMGSEESFAPVYAADAVVAAAAEAYHDASTQGKSEDEVLAAREAWKAAMAAADAARDERYRKQSEAYEALRAVGQKFNLDRAEKVRELVDAKGAAIIAKIIEASPITAEQATAWANEQIIDDNAKRKLKKDGYDPEQVRRDMAEYYRITGGKASTIRLSLDGSKRANAVGIATRTGEKVVNLGSGFDKTTLWHELAHHLENDPIARGMSNGFLLKRRESPTRYSLRSLTGNKGYRKDEAAYKDHFMNPYVGKIYDDGITEVFSMGVQYLAQPKDAALLATKDPEMFAMITGYLTAAATPAQAAKLEMHKGAVNLGAQMKQDAESQFQRAVALLAKEAVVTKDDWLASLDQTTDEYRRLSWYVLERGKKGPAKYFGSFGRYRVFTGVFRNPATKRNATGYLVAEISDDGEMAIFGESAAVHGDLETVQACIATAVRTGDSVQNTNYRFFLDGWRADRKQKLIELVGVENLK